VKNVVQSGMGKFQFAGLSRFANRNQRIAPMQCSAWHWLPPRFTKKHSRHFLARGMHAGPGLVRKHKTASGYPPAFFYPSLKFEKQEKNANLAHPTVMGLDAILYFFRSVSNPLAFHSAHLNSRSRPRQGCRRNW
jgi:hypothetical protein